MFSVVFPGQGSQFVGMTKELYSDFNYVKELFQQADDALGFSLSKIIWLMKNVSDIKKALENNDVIFGTVDSWLIYKLNGTLQTDVTNASRTLLFDLESLTWNENILNEYNIPKDSLPNIKHLLIPLSIVDNILYAFIPVHIPSYDPLFNLADDDVLVFLVYPAKLKS